MSDRIPSDHDSIDEYRVRLGSVGRTDRPEIELPDATGDALTDGDTIRLFLEGRESHTQVERAIGDRLVVRGCYDNARLARAGTPSDDQLAGWCDARTLQTGVQLLLDVVTPGFEYGLRRPGQRVLYPNRQPRDDDLAEIARSLEE